MKKISFKLRTNVIFDIGDELILEDEMISRLGISNHVAIANIEDKKEEKKIKGGN